MGDELEAGGRPRLRVTWHRCAVDWHDHAVTDEEFTWGTRRSEGRYAAVCGHLVAVDSMLLPPGLLCPRCKAVLQERAKAHQTKHGPAQRHQQPGILRRLFRRVQTPAVSPTLPTPARRRDGRIPAGTGGPPLASAPAGHHEAGAVS